MSKKCQNCGAEMADNMNFCPQCHAKYAAPSAQMNTAETSSTIESAPSQASVPNQSLPPPLKMRRCSFNKCRKPLPDGVNVCPACHVQYDENLDIMQTKAENFFTSPRFIYGGAGLSIGVALLCYLISCYLLPGCFVILLIITLVVTILYAVCMSLGYKHPPVAKITAIAAGVAALFLSYFVFTNTGTERYSLAASLVNAGQFNEKELSWKEVEAYSDGTYVIEKLNSDTLLLCPLKFKRSGGGIKWTPADTSTQNYLELIKMKNTTDEEKALNEEEE